MRKTNGEPWNDEDYLSLLLFALVLIVIVGTIAAVGT